MNNNETVSILKRHFNPSLLMLENLIDRCPEELWSRDNRDGSYWKQILHVLNGIKGWLRYTKGDIELSDENYMNKEEMMNFFNEMRENYLKFIEETDKLYSPHNVYGKINNFDSILMTMRHIQYHIGYCNRILNENNIEEVKWIGYRG